MYKKKIIKCGQRNTVILVQNENGPCPFLAIVNTLLLRKSKAVEFIPMNEDPISGETITQNLINYLFETKSNKDVDELLSHAVENLNKLQSGLNINIKFMGITEFEKSPELAIFELFNIPLVHGWLIDPQDEISSNVMRSLSYNQAIELCTQETDQSLVIRDFFSSCPAQLTVYGLTKLHEDLRDDELCILFRNNHFSTIVKHNQEIFMLVTDQGYFQVKEITWEKYQDIGSSEFYKGNFEKYSYQEEKDAEYARSLQQTLPVQKQKKVIKQQQEECLIL